MIKLETIGMLDRVVINPVIKVNADVANYTFVTDNGETYLIANTITGDDAYKENVSFAANECLNGLLVKSLEGQKLVADEKHIAYGSGVTYADITAGTTLMKVNDAGKLVICDSAPSSGVYFKVTDKCTLTEKAVKLMVLVVDATGE